MARSGLVLVFALCSGVVGCEEDCDVSLSDCPDSCTVAEGYKLRASGCLSRELEPAGCTDFGEDAPSVLTAAQSSDGACWRFPVQVLPHGFRPGCEAAIREAMECPASGAR